MSLAVHFISLHCTASHCTELKITLCWFWKQMIPYWAVQPIQLLCWPDNSNSALSRRTALENRVLENRSGKFTEVQICDVSRNHWSVWMLNNPSLPGCWGQSLLRPPHSSHWTNCIYFLLSILYTLTIIPCSAALYCTTLYTALQVTPV